MKGTKQSLYDFIGAPLRLLLFPDKWSEKIGLTSLQRERLDSVIPHISGNLLDIGCGDNLLVKEYGNGVGVDVYDWGGGALIVDDTKDLPFDDFTFDTVTMVACLNHIPERDEVIREVFRVLKSNGKVIVTMINPVLGLIGHKVWWYSEDKERGTMPGEKDGLWNHDVIELFENRGFTLETHKRFVYFMNNIFVFRKT